MKWCKEVKEERQQKLGSSSTEFHSPYIAAGDVYAQKLIPHPQQDPEDKGIRLQLQGKMGLKPPDKMPFPDTHMVQTLRGFGRVGEHWDTWPIASGLNHGQLFTPGDRTSMIVSDMCCDLKTFGKPLSTAALSNSVATRNMCLVQTEMRRKSKIHTRL